MSPPRAWPGGRTCPALRVYASAEAHSSIEKACMTLGLGRERRSSGSPVDERLRHATRGARGGDRRGPGRRPPADRDRRDDRHDLVDRGRSRRGHRRRSPSARACGSTSMRPTPAPVALLPDRRGAVRRLGAGRLDRRQPAQVAVHAARRVAAADAADGRPARGVQPRPGVPAHARSRDAGPRLQRVHAAARAAVPGAQAVDPAALVRARRAAAPDRAPPRAGAGVRRLGRRRSRLGAAGAGPVLDGLLPLEPGRRDATEARRWTRATPRSWTPSTGPARCSCRTPASTAGSRSAWRSATCARSRATSSGPGRCCARPPRA